MKIRNGFVSNSSSSSFIIPINDKNRDKIHYDYLVKEIEYDFNSQINCTEESMWDEETQTFITFEEYLIKNKFSIDERKENYISYSRVIPIIKANEAIGRHTCIAFGNELREYASKEYDENLNTIIDTYGIDNILYMRESDEGMGGVLPTELQKLKEEAITGWDFH